MHVSRPSYHWPYCASLGLIRIQCQLGKNMRVLCGPRCGCLNIVNKASLCGLTEPALHLTAVNKQGSDYNILMQSVKREVQCAIYCSQQIYNILLQLFHLYTDDKLIMFTSHYAGNFTLSVSRMDLFCIYP